MDLKATRHGNAWPAGERACRGCWRNQSAFLFRRIAEPRIPDRRPDEARGAEHEERHPPSVAYLDRQHQQRRDGAADLAGHQIHSGDRGALPRRKPTRHHDCRIRKCAGFAGPEEEPGDEQRVEAGHRARQRGERRPPHHDAREHAPRTEAIAHHACRDFEETVGEGEHPGHPSPPDGVDPQVFLHARSGHRDADPIEIGDGKQQDEQSDDTATVARGARQVGRIVSQPRVHSRSIRGD